MSSERYKRRLYRISDGLTEGLIYFAILFGPWAFGTTQPWSIQVMNGVGLALGLLWLIKLGLRCAQRRAPSTRRSARTPVHLAAGGGDVVYPAVLPNQRLERARDLSSQPME